MVSFFFRFSPFLETQELVSKVKPEIESQQNETEAAWFVAFLGVSRRKGLFSFFFCVY